MEFLRFKNYLHNIRFYILFSFILFCASLCLGYVFAQTFQAETREILEQLKSVLSPIGEETPFTIFEFILENNATKLFSALIFGIFAGIIPLIVVFVNGMVLGIFSYIIIQEMSLFFLLAGIMPHGILEIPALIVSTAIGLRIGTVSIRKVFGGEESVIDELAKGLEFFIIILLPMILAAALIETFITHQIMSLVA